MPVSRLVEGREVSEPQEEPLSEVEVIPYRVGLCAASVYTNGTVENAIKYMNDIHITGLDHGWTLSTDVFQGHDSNVVPCNQHPTTHTHVLFEC